MICLLNVCVSKGTLEGIVSIVFLLLLIGLMMAQRILMLRLNTDVSYEEDENEENGREFDEDDFEEDDPDSEYEQYEAMEGQITFDLRWSETLNEEITVTNNSDQIVTVEFSNQFVKQYLTTLPDEISLEPHERCKIRMENMPDMFVAKIYIEDENDEEHEPITSCEITRP